MRAIRQKILLEEVLIDFTEGLWRQITEAQSQRRQIAVDGHGAHYGPRIRLPRSANILLEGWELNKLRTIIFYLSTFTSYPG